MSGVLSPAAYASQVAAPHFGLATPVNFSGWNDPLDQGFPYWSAPRTPLRDLGLSLFWIRNSDDRRLTLRSALVCRSAAGGGQLCYRQCH